MITVCGFIKDPFIRNRLLLFLFALYTAASGTTVDTTLVADGSPGPYPLGRLFVDTATIRALRSDSAFLPPFTYVSSVNGLLFSDAVDSGVRIRVQFETDFDGLPKVYSLFAKRYAEAGDTASVRRDSSGAAAVASAAMARENLAVSGYKTVGVSIGSFGEVNLEQGLDVRIGGEIRPGTELSAHLSDQGTSLDGATREISEFDMIYIALTDRRFSVVAGDQYVDWPISSGIFQGRKKIKGIMASVTPKTGMVKAFGALAGGNFTVQTWKGDGGQGPYTFTGNGEAGFITPIGGTIRLTVNGKVCEEGDDKAFVVDYDLGTFTFTPRLLIKPEDLVRAEYEYKMFDYQRTMTGGAASAAFGDSVLSVTGALWSEIDNKNNPIELTLSDGNKAALESGGDQPPLDTAAEAVDARDVLTRYATIPLYGKKDTLGVTMFVYREVDPENPLRNDSLFDVHFSEVADGCGDYVRLPSEKYPDYIYRYAGTCGGRYAPLTALSAPQRRTSGELRADLKLPIVKMTVDAAGQERDKNLFSGVDDDDNLASAANVTALFGAKRYDRRSFWLGGNWQLWSARFDREALSAFDRKSGWNDYALTERQVERQTWESTAGVTPFSGASAELLYGQQRLAGEVSTDKIGGVVKYHPLNWLHLDYNGTYFRHFEENGRGEGQRQDGRLSLRFKKHTGALHCRNEWRRGVLGEGAGLVESGLTYEFLPLHLAEEFTYTIFRGGRGGFLAAADTGSAVVWQQSLQCKPRPWWTVNGRSAWQLRQSDAPGGRQRTTTLLIDVSSETGESGSAFSSQQRYRTNAEKSSRFVQIPVYVGEGRGTHRWDSTRTEYVEDLHGAGNFIIQQRDVFDSTNNFRMRKSVFSVNWSFDPPSGKTKGLLADLSWEGMLYLEEHIDAAETHPSTWAPGYRSLRAAAKGETPPAIVPYCDLNYRQDIDWNPSFNRELKGTLLLMPDYRRIRSYRERGLTGEIGGGRSRTKFTVDSRVRLFSLVHEDTLRAPFGNEFSLTDISARLTQTRHIAGAFDISLRECVGWARQNNKGTSGPTVGIDSSYYIQLTPGAAWIAGARGRVEAEYTLSLLTVPEGHDYRIASGFATGLSHVINVFGDVRIGKYFTLSASYRGEIFGRRPAGNSGPARHVMSVEVRAFL